MSNFVGKTLGLYTLEASLGRGGMATVYRAFQTTVKRYVAVKVMSPEIASNPGFIERFSREAEVIASLQHPHILPIIDYGEADGVHFLVMRYIENGSLDDRMRKNSLTLPEIARFLEQIASALDYAHKRGVVHRDFKPNNVLLDADDNTYLTDFGIARLTQDDSRLTATGTVLGTPAYMSPEQGMGKPVDGRSDIYALGVVLYEMVLNRLPFSAETPAALIFQHVYEMPIPPKQIKPDLPDAIATVIGRAMAKDPDARYQTASDMSHAFNAAIAGRSSTSDTNTAQDTLQETLVGEPFAPVITSNPKSVSPPPIKSTNPKAIDRTLPPGTGPLPLPPTNIHPPTVPIAIPLPTASPRRSGIPIVLIAIAVLVLLSLGGGYFVISHNQTATDTAHTAVAFLALSATATPTHTLTPTHTPTPTDTPTSTVTPSLTDTITSTPTKTQTLRPSATMTLTWTPSPLPTETIDATLTVLSQQLALVATFHANVTATQNVAITQAAAASVTAIAAANNTATSAANAAQLALTPSSTPTVLVSTVSPSKAPTVPSRVVPIATLADVPSTALPVATIADDNDTLQAYSGAPEAVMNTLQAGGVLTSIVGSSVLQRDQYQIAGTDANSTYWKVLDPNLVVSDFVMAADVIWNSTNTGNECGFLFRLGGVSSKEDLYAAMITLNGSFDGYSMSAGTDNGNYANKASSVIKTGLGEHNHLLLTARGNAFRFFVNGKLVSAFTQTKFPQGTLAVAGSTGADGGPTCSFQNIWVWQLGGHDALAAGLTASDPSTVVTTLAQAGDIAPDKATIAYQNAQQAVTLTTTGYNWQPLANDKFQNFVISTDVSTDSTATDTACGLVYGNQTATTSDNWNVFFYQLDQTYAVYTRKNAVWAAKAQASGTSSLLDTTNGASNRLTLIVNAGKLTVYINGQFAFNADSTTFPTGSVAYYIQSQSKNVSNATCRFSNTTLWTLN